MKIKEPKKLIHCRRCDQELTLRELYNPEAQGMNLCYVCARVAREAYDRESEKRGNE